MSPPRLPDRPVALPHHPATRHVLCPRSIELLELPVDTLEDVETDVLAVDEERSVDVTVLIEHHGCAIMCDALEAKVSHLASSATHVPHDDPLVTDSLLVHPPDVAPTDDDVRLLTLDSEIEEDVIPRHLDVASIERASEVVGRWAPVGVRGTRD